MKKIETKDICYMGLFVALITVCGWISWDMGGVKGFSLQLLGVYVCAGLLGPKRGAIAVGVYILLGAIGVPVFAQFTSGLFTAPTRGYVIGFLPTAVMVGLGERIVVKARDQRAEKWWKWLVRGGIMVLATAGCYLFGTIWFVVYNGTQGQSYSVWQALTWCVFPYFWFDLIKIVLAVIIVERLKKELKF